MINYAKTFILNEIFVSDLLKVVGTEFESV